MKRGITDTSIEAGQAAEAPELAGVAEVCRTTPSSWLLLMRVYDRIQRHAADHLECYDLTPAQYDVLAQLTEAPGISQQELAGRLLVTKGNVCGLIDRLQDRKLVERRNDPDDRRLHLLHLTEEGHRVATSAIPAYGDFIREHMSVLSDEEQRTLAELLRKLDRYLDDH